MARLCLSCTFRSKPSTAHQQRAKQIESGAAPFVAIASNVIDSYIIAEDELKQKKIPFIIRRPIPNGGFEYWNINDLEILI